MQGQLSAVINQPYSRIPGMVSDISIIPADGSWSALLRRESAPDDRVNVTESKKTVLNTFTAVIEKKKWLNYTNK